MTDLLDAVEALTKPTIDHIPQMTDDGVYLRTHTVNHPPLLEQMRDAVVPSTGNDAGSKSASPRERNMVDSAALFEYSKICSQLWDWCRIVGSDISKEPVSDLTRWYIAHTTRPDHHDDWYTRQLGKWANLIRNQLAPPKRVELLLPCPICGPGPWADHDGETQVNRLVMEYRINDREQPTDERVLCRNPNCATTWEGEDAILELRDEDNEKTGATHGTP